MKLNKYSDVYQKKSGRPNLDSLAEGKTLAAKTHFSLKLREKKIKIIFLLVGVSRPHFVSSEKILEAGMR